MAEVVTVDVEAGVALVTLNRPDSMNALDSELLDRLPHVLRALAHDPEVGCVVLTGAGRGFCAGGDLKSRQAEHDAIAQLSEAERNKLTAAYRVDGLLKARSDSPRLLHDMSKPTIAMINGPCAGAGLSLAGACDLRISADSAVFSIAFTSVGLCGDFGGTWFWTQILGAAKARELYMLPRRMTAQEALERGMVTQLVPDAQLREHTMKIAREIAAGPRWAYAYAKDNLNIAEDGTLDRVLQAEAMTQGLSGRTNRQFGFVPASVLSKSK
ncbi:MAG: enoyl-CoA hydratase/isomerase family protein [Ramlibacter sp.]